MKIPSKTDYNAGANLTFEIVGAYKVRAPRFRFPPEGVALIASIADVGDNLCVNSSARDLVAYLLAECKRRKLGDFPTVMMLQVCLEMHGLEVDRVPFEDLGIKGEMMPLATGRKGRN